MSRNNSKSRKEQRTTNAEIRENESIYRDCGHWHNTNGYKKCPYNPKNWNEDS